MPAPSPEVVRLFADQRNLRASVDAVLEGRAGRTSVRGGAARLDVGPFAFFGGDADAPGARDLVLELPIPRAVVGPEPWRVRTQELHSARHCVPQQRTRFSCESLDDDRLRPLCETKGELRALDAALLDRALGELSEDLRVDSIYPTSEAFFHDGGFGFAVLENDRMRAAATSAILASRRIEIQINTDPDHFHAGWGTVAGAAIALEARKRALEPGWDTANPASYGLAEKLGYVPVEEHAWLMVF